MTARTIHRVFLLLPLAGAAAGAALPGGVAAGGVEVAGSGAGAGLGAGGVSVGGAAGGV
jgi:hypothetical protein